MYKTMDWHSLALTGLLSAALLTGCGNNHDDEDEGELGEYEPHFTYQANSPTGPANWGALHSEWNACAQGKIQTPIDLTNASSKDLPNIQFNYMDSAVSMTNSGHTVQYRYDAGSSLTIDGKVYQLLQFHFHNVSEHTIAGKSFPLELHLVHKDDAGQLAVVGIMLQGGATSFAPLSSFSSLPTGHLATRQLDGLRVAALQLLPATDRTYYTYTGSLTTPPCTEGVKWLVLKQPLTIEAGQIDSFSQLFPEGSARPLQPLNGREISLDNTM